MRGSYNRFMLKQALRCNPPLIKLKCATCYHWDEATQSEFGDNTGLCKKWQVFTRKATSCELYTGKPSK